MKNEDIMAYYYAMSVVGWALGRNKERMSGNSSPTRI